MMDCKVVIWTISSSNLNSANDYSSLYYWVVKNCLIFFVTCFRSLRFSSTNRSLSSYFYLIWAISAFIVCRLLCKFSIWVSSDCFCWLNWFMFLSWFYFRSFSSFSFCSSWFSKAWSRPISRWITENRSRFSWRDCCLFRRSYYAVIRLSFFWRNS